MDLAGVSFWQAYWVAFASGVLVSFTPCIYPVIPLTATYIAGVNTRGSRWMGFFLSLLYVFGMAFTYCSLAIFAALTGKVFGGVQNHPVIFVIVAVVLMFFALVMLDIVPIPNFGATLQSRARPKNLWTVVLFGMASGLVVGPCTAPVLGTLLLYIGSKQNIVHAVSLMFVFSYGVGASLILVGTFSGILSALPNSGLWLVRVKQFCGGLLALMSIYFIYRAVQFYL